MMSDFKTIGLDARCLLYPALSERGIGRYFIEHLKAICQLCPNWRYKLFLDDLRSLDPLRELLVFKQCEVSSFYDGSLRELNVFHAPDPMSIIPFYDSPFLLAPSEVPFTITFYDLIPIVFKAEYFDKWPEVNQQAYRLRLQQLLTRAPRALCISNSSASDLKTYLNYPEERIEVVMAGFNEVSKGEGAANLKTDPVIKFGIEAPYYLVVGGIDPHKNFQRTLEAFLSIKARHRVNLVVVGSLNDPWKHYYRDLLKSRNETGVVFTGFVEAEELVELYSKSLATVFPSQYEGFGFPALEAMALGSPIITSKVASLPEVVGEAGILVDPNSVEQVRSAMESVLANSALREKFKLAGHERSRLFSWSKVAESTVKIWNEMGR